MKEKPLNSLWLSLSDTNYNGSEIISKLSENGKLQQLFNADAGVWEGYSIREHTLLVYKIFEEQFDVYRKFYSFNPNKGIRLWEMMKILIALHDIGKPIAIQNGDKSEQHSHTVDILSEQMHLLDFSREEIQLCVALVGHDYIGKMIKSDKDAVKTKELLLERADMAKHSLEDFFPLQAFYYCADAAAYPGLRKRIFKTKNQLLMPTSESYHDLHELILKNRID